ncbi:putative metalloprotease [Saccharothrix ecbatanensis]|uniref:Putative metalloprotease n=1 Tax=Saccharothrix ecbatanensis TaxID=1105145 RepID=A0A7W9HST9_9PSEU|nr:neutral zinc metallopeptidase [Saccharothrix ecbatanensis]MBB5807814.1 putative metalloprotease [Saccharothrix ecbatanensis]
MHTPEEPKNNPIVLIGVFSLIVLCVLGLGGITQLETTRRINGRAVAAPDAGSPVAQSTPAEPPRPRAVHRLADHPLLVTPTRLPSVTCALPVFGLSDPELSAYYKAGVTCLDQAWQPALVQANLPFDPPALDTAPDLTDGPCGTAPAESEAVAYYCGRNRTIYMPTQRLRDNGGGDRAGSHLATLAHEYGHHVQALTGMLRAADSKIVDAGEETPAGLEMSRRIELQANCFAGMFLVAASGSIGPGLAEEAAEDFHYAMEEPPEKNAHGSPDNQGVWASHGFTTGVTSSCNTYAASAEAVG